MSRVVVTGMGVVSPLGCEVDVLFENLVNSKRNFAYSNQLKKIYSEGKKATSNVSSDFESLCEKYGIEPVRSFSNYSKLAIKQALHDARLWESDIDLDLYIGTCESFTFERKEYLNALESEIENCLLGKRPFEIIAEIAAFAGVKGEVLSFPVACTGGNIAIAIGAKKILYGNRNVCVVGGADFLTDKIYSTFYSLGSLAKNYCKPFDKERDGITVGEGAAFLILENLQYARRRNAKIYAEIRGVDIACDAYHLTTPDKDGKMAALSIEKVLEKSNLNIQDVSYISPHATGTIANELQEANALAKVFGAILPYIPISAIKSLLGHCMGAASAMEAISIIKSIEKNIIPQTVNSDMPDDNFKYPLKLYDYSLRDVSIVLSNSYAFGGNICNVVFSKF